MSTPSQWPLPPQGMRFLTPAFLLQQLHRHPLTRDCYPTAMGYYPRAHSHRMRRARHDDNLLMYCVDGFGRLRLGEASYSVGAGDLVLLPQGLAHSYNAATSQPWTIYWVHFQGVSSRIFSEYLGYAEKKPVLHVGLAPTLAMNFHSLLSVGQTGYSSSAFINAANQLRHLFTQFALAAKHEQAAQPAGLDLETLRAYMQENIHHSLELDDLAAVAHLSKYHFSKRYRALTGYSPIKHFLHMKIEYACQLLDSSELSVKSIAATIGYDDPLYFSRLFRKVMGLSPRAYRHSVRK
ncbi:AraC family transcriptional regulator [Parahaliea sp. F7430]|uniref:AraC family transcriptional regulator n=1 Tax=Sediminihaliea albiluteola TaxID=2758564 RepID=A0A7W2TWZ0_9GAMM|nr:AraC family transcriptional regulator [Sediminihaliea albiluteola]MBA6413490.1 AraC family transcriptional regulator [Sediminihaliea albiluteola]